MEIVNFRDFGGYQGFQGTVRKGVFYRGASLANVSQAAGIFAWVILIFKQ